MLEFEGAGDIIGQLELSMKRDERIIRFLTVKMDKHHAAWAEKRKSRIKGAKTATAEA